MNLLHAAHQAAVITLIVGPLLALFIGLALHAGRNQ